MEDFDFALDPELYAPIASTSAYQQGQQFESESDASESEMENEISGGDESQSEEETDAEEEYNNAIGQGGMIKKKKVDRKEKGKQVESQGMDGDDDEALG